MVSREQIVQILNSYLSLYPEERDGFLVFEEQLRDETSDITSRKNFTGHVIADGCVIDPKHKKILMIYHATHLQWFIPSGHIDAEDEHPAHAARREVLDETGVRADYVLDEAKQPLLLHVHSHMIPLSEKKQELEHWHHGLTFLFVADSTRELPKNIDAGVTQCRWMDIAEVQEYDGYRAMIDKLELQ